MAKNLREQLDDECCILAHEVIPWLLESIYFVVAGAGLGEGSTAHNCQEAEFNGNYQNHVLEPFFLIKKGLCLILKGSATF